MDSFVFHYLLVWRPLGYLLVFFGMMIEGDALLFSASFLARHGFFDIGDMAMVVFAGILIGDMGWYWLGRAIGISSSRISRWMVRVTQPFDDHLIHRPLRTIFISKFAYGLHHPILMRAGSLRMDFKNFLQRDILSTVPWMVLIGGFGYLSGASFLALRHTLRFAEEALLAGFIIFFFLQAIIRWSSKRRL